MTLRLLGDRLDVAELSITSSTLRLSVKNPGFFGHLEKRFFDFFLLNVETFKKFCIFIDVRKLTTPNHPKTYNKKYLHSAYIVLHRAYWGWGRNEVLFLYLCKNLQPLRAQNLPLKYFLQPSSIHRMALLHNPKPLERKNRFISPGQPKWERCLT